MFHLNLPQHIQSQWCGRDDDVNEHFLPPLHQDMSKHIPSHSFTFNFYYGSESKTNVS